MTARLARTFRVQPPSGLAITKYVRTLRHLKLSQIYERLRKEAFPVRSVTILREHVSRRNDVQYLRFAKPISPDVEPGQIKFLNNSRKFEVESIDWRCMEAPKLWRYNLHYFDYLHWQTYTLEMKDRLISSWIDCNPFGSPDAWEPYTVSLRTVNWIKYFLLRKSSAFIPESWEKSLAEQVLWLESNLEFDLLANHLLKNAKALVFAGVFFSEEMGRRHLEKGMLLMLEQVSEQFLADGGHFERSPMYHSICLEDCLDVINLLSLNATQLQTGDLLELRTAATRALRFLEDILCPDGDIPLFNDAALGIAPRPSELLAYGRRVLSIPPKSVSHQPARIWLPATGYFGYKFNGDSLVIDCGPIGPDYQPGHGHCDMLSYELCINGRRVLVDSGVHDYEVGELRHYTRSTAAHNTIRIDETEQSEIWGAFRVARRAKPVFVELSDWQGENLEFRGVHDGYSRLPGKPAHERHVSINLSGRWKFSDVVTGGGSHLIESFIHVHPDYDVKRENGCSYIIQGANSPVARIRVESDCEIAAITGICCSEFGKPLENQVLALSLHGRLPLSLTYTVEKI